MIADLFKKTREDSLEIKSSGALKRQNSIITCKKCGKLLVSKSYEENNFTCPACNSYGRMTAKQRISRVCDEGSFVEINEDLQGLNPLKFEGYAEKLKKTQEKTGLKEAVLTGTAKIEGKDVAIGLLSSDFFMGSLNTAVGEKISRLFELAILERLPVVMIIASGGARLHEGMMSLVQMAKVSAVCKKHSDAGLLYISVLTDPTMGGVTASFATLGDIILAEKGASIGFAGLRVIESTVGETLDSDFQSAENALKNGFVDKVFDREELKPLLANILSLHMEV